MEKSTNLLRRNFWTPPWASSPEVVSTGTASSPPWSGPAGPASPAARRSTAASHRTDHTPALLSLCPPPQTLTGPEQYSTVQYSTLQYKHWQVLTVTSAIVSGKQPSNVYLKCRQKKRVLWEVNLLRVWYIYFFLFSFTLQNISAFQALSCKSFELLKQIRIFNQWSKN